MSKNSTTVSFVAEVAGDVNRLMHSHEEGNMLILPLRDSILFPGTVNPITIGRKSSLKAVKHAELMVGNVKNVDADMIIGRTLTIF